jgi:hypothetical protein
MYTFRDVSGASGIGATRRKLKTTAAAKFSPSFGVHRGFIRDPNWPPPVMPENSHANARRHLRVAANFTVVLDGLPARVTGDLSRGGAMFLLPRDTGTREVLVQVGVHAARLKVLGVSDRAGQAAYHGQFLDRAESAPLWAAFQKR